MNIDDRRPTDRPTNDQRPTHGLFTGIGKFQMAISQRCVVRSTSCLFLGWGLGGRRIKRRHFRLGQIQYGGRRPFWKISDGYISATRRPIDFVFGSMVGFSGTADRHFRLYPIRQPFCKFTWPYLSTAFSDSRYVCTQIILCPRTL